MPRNNGEIIGQNFDVIVPKNLSSSQNFQNYRNKQITIFINNKKQKIIKLFVNSDDLIEDIIIKYKNKLQNDKIKNIYFKTENGKYIFPEKKLEETGITNNSTIYAEYDEDDLSKEQLEKLKNTIKEKYKQGIITLQIYKVDLGTEFYYVDKNVKFKVVADQFRKKNPGKKFYFVVHGLVIDEQKTLKELNIKMLSKILAEEYLGD